MRHSPYRPGTSNRSRTAGLTLVELLVAMTLGLVILGSVIGVFSGNRRTSQLNAAMTNMQENARFALNTIASDIRMAGHQGCLDANASPVQVIASDAPTTDLRVTAVGGAVVQSDGTWAPALTLGTGTLAFTPPVTNAAVAGTHAIALQFGGPETSALARGMADGGVADSTLPLALADPLNVSVGDTVMVSTCEQGEIFSVTGVAPDGTGQELSHAAGANTRSSFLEPYGINGTAGRVRVMPFSTNIYYVGDTGRQNTQGDPIRALYQQSAPFTVANPPVELVQGVENLRLSFAIGSGGGRLRYVTSADGTYDSRRVRGVRVGLLMSSIDRIAADDDTNTYVLAGQPIAPSKSSTDGTTYKADKRFRLAFNTTVKVRNRRAND